MAVIYNKHAYITKKDEKTWNTSTNLVSFGQLVVEKTDVKSLDSDVSKEPMQGPSLPGLV